MFPETVTH